MPRNSLDRRGHYSCLPRFVSACSRRCISTLCLLIAATERDYFVPNMHGCIPGDRNGILHTCVGGTSLGMNSNCAHSSFARIRWNSEVVVNSYRLNADGLPSTRNAAIHRGRIALAVKTNLAP